ncbi:MAG: hypothetical protein ACSHXY_00525 [Alphaproteobacteria bacterium]
MTRNILYHIPIILGASSLLFGGCTETVSNSCTNFECNIADTQILNQVNSGDFILFENARVPDGDLQFVLTTQRTEHQQAQPKHSVTHLSQSMPMDKSQAIIRHNKIALILLIAAIIFSSIFGLGPRKPEVSEDDPILKDFEAFHREEVNFGGTYV